MAQVDLYASSDHQHESLRDDVLLAGGVPRRVCNGGPDTAHAGLILSIRGYVTQAQSERVAALSLYWHFVDVVWIVVFLVVYAIGR